MLKSGDHVFWWFREPHHIAVKRTGVVVQLSGQYARVRLDLPHAVQVQVLEVKYLFPLVDDEDST